MEIKGRKCLDNGFRYFIAIYRQIRRIDKCFRIFQNEAINIFIRHFDDKYFLHLLKQLTAAGFEMLSFVKRSLFFFSICSYTGLWGY